MTKERARRGEGSDEGRGELVVEARGAGLVEGRGAVVVDGRGAVARCRWCQRPLARRDGPGRPRQYCRQSCRQRDYEARQRAAERGLDEGEIIMTRANLDALRDRLWVLACAVQDVEGDLQRAVTVDEYRAAVDWLMEAARPLVGGSAGSQEDLITSQ